MLKVNYLAVKEMVRYCVKYKKALIHVSGTIVHPHLQVYSIKSKLNILKKAGCEKSQLIKWIKL